MVLARRRDDVYLPTEPPDLSFIDTRVDGELANRGLYLPVDSVDGRDLSAILNALKKYDPSDVEPWCAAVDTLGYAAQPMAGLSIVGEESDWWRRLVRRGPSCAERLLDVTDGGGRKRFMPIGHIHVYRTQDVWPQGQGLSVWYTMQYYTRAVQTLNAGCLWVPIVEGDLALLEGVTIPLPSRHTSWDVDASQQGDLAGAVDRGLLHAVRIALHLTPGKRIIDKGLAEPIHPSQLVDRLIVSGVPREFAIMAPGLALRMSDHPYGPTSNDLDPYLSLGRDGRLYTRPSVGSRKRTTPHSEAKWTHRKAARPAGHTGSWIDRQQAPGVRPGETEAG